jgi:ADP-L-glycero-D-manno-heptose 6-epimerase
MKIQKDDLVLVTGGSGMIGSALIWALNQRGIHRIWVSDFLGSDERFKNLLPLVFEDYIEADDLLEKIERNSPELSQIRYIFHLGACSSTTETDFRYLICNNYNYTKKLATWACAQKNVRFVYASSAATYGNGEQGGMEDAEESLQALRPLNMYGYSKHLFDLWAQKKGLLSQIVGLKYFNIFGPNEYHKQDMRSVVHKAFTQIQEHGYIELFKSYHPNYKDGEQQRDFLYVKDAVQMTIHLAETEQAAGIFNLGSGIASTWIELVTPIFEALQRPTSIRFMDMPAAIRAKYQYFTQANISKLRATQYQQPVTTLKSAVFDYVKNYLMTGVHLGDEINIVN